MNIFSIIMPSYNSAKHLPGTLQHIQQQSFKDWELIVVDDGSTDETEQVLASFLEKDKIKYIKQDNKGVSAARNTGIKHANGRFVTFLDTDDAVSKTWLQDFYDLITNVPNAGYVSCGYVRNTVKVAPKVVKQIVADKHSTLAGTFCVKKEIVEHIGGYDVQLKQSENWEFTARALEYCKKNNLAILHTSNYNFLYHHHPSPEQTKIRDAHRAEATYYLFQKYAEKGILHYRKKDFLLSSAVNYTRAENFSESRKIFYKMFSQEPSLQNLFRILVFEIPPLRKKKWMRN